MDAIAIDASLPACEQLANSLLQTRDSGTVAKVTQVSIPAL